MLNPLQAKRWKRHAAKPALADFSGRPEYWTIADASGEIIGTVYRAASETGWICRAVGPHHFGARLVLHGATDVVEAATECETILRDLGWSIGEKHGEPRT